MENAITYKDLYLSFGEVISMDRLEIVQSPNRHGRMQLSAVLNGEGEGEVFDELPGDVSVLYREDGEEKVLFKGMVAESSMERVGNHRKMELKAYDATYLLDTKRKTRSFQDTSRTNHSVIAEVMKEYPECICMKNLPEKPIGRIWFQYEETDWEFLRRFLSSYSDSLYADATCHTARFQAGLSPEDIEVDWDDCPYGMGKNLERFDFLSQNGFDGLALDRFIEYSVDSYGLYPLGSRLIYKGRRWYVGELTRRLTDGLLTTTYRLQQREGLLKPQEYNRRITGVSLDGKTVKVQGDTVRVSMNGDMTTEQGTYWFPFSTFASSADGSGWYSMPEVGDSIRVYFPTCDEKEGYVITKHDSHMPASGKAAGGSTQAAPAKVKFAAAMPAKEISAAVMPGKMVSAAFMPAKEISAAVMPAKAISTAFMSAKEISAAFMPAKEISAAFIPEKKISAAVMPKKGISANAVFINKEEDLAAKNGDSQVFIPEQPIGSDSPGKYTGGFQMGTIDGITFSEDSGRGGKSGGNVAGRGSSGKSSSNASGGGSSESGGSADGGGGGSESGGSADGGGGSSESGGSADGGGGSESGGSTAAGNAAAPEEPEEKEDPEEEDPMGDPSKRNIFTKEGCTVRLNQVGLILTAGKSTLIIKNSGEIFMKAPLGISISAGKNLSISADSMSFRAGKAIEIKDDSGADIMITDERLKMHGKEIFEN